MRRSNKRTVVWFGAGGAGKAYLFHTGERPDFFVDNSETLHDSLVSGVPVFAPSILKTLTAPEVVITSGYVVDIRNQLRELGVPDERISITPKSLLGLHPFSTNKARSQFASSLSALFSQLDEPKSVICAGGTALGFVREGDFLEWDFDVDLFCRASVKESLIAALDASGRWETLGKEQDYLWGHLRFDQGDTTVPIGIKFFSERSLEYIDQYLSKTWVLPTSMLLEPAEVIVQGRVFYVPNPPERYLSGLYGSDWKVPRPDFTYDDYGGD